MPGVNPHPVPSVLGGGRRATDAGLICVRHRGRGRCSVGSLNMRIVRLLVVAVPLVAATALLSSCAAEGGRGVPVPTGAELLDQCAPETLRVEDLASRGEPGCDLIGSSVYIQDGPTLEIRGVGGASSYQDSSTGSVEYLMVNWGVPGIAVSVVEEGRLIDLWASSASAEKLQRQQLSLQGITGD